MKRIIFLLIFLFCKSALANDPTFECFDRAYADPRLSILIPKVGAIGNIDDISLEQLTSKEKPTDDEKKALRLWAEFRKECELIGRPIRQQAVPEVASVMLEYHMLMIQLTARLYSDEITYGEFNVERQKQGSRYLAKMNQLQQEHARSIQQDYAPPSMTTCRPTGFGGGMRCFTR